MIEDPFLTATAAASPQTDTSRNAKAICALSRELGELQDMEAIRAHVVRHNSNRRYDAPALDERKEVARARRTGPSTKWSDLDLLAIRGAGAAIVAADGRGEAVTADEARNLSSRRPEVVSRAARQIVARMADPTTDVLILERASSIKEFLPELCE